MLNSWTMESRKRFGTLGSRGQQGPDGCWNAMVLANEVQDPQNVEGFGYPAVHKVDVFFWKDNVVHFESFFWTAGTFVEVVE